MGTVGRRRVLSLLALVLGPSTFFVPAPNLIQPSEAPIILPASVTPAEPLVPPATRLNAFPFRLTTYGTNTSCSPYAQTLNRVRSTLGLSDRLGASGEWAGWSQY